MHSELKRFSSECPRDDREGARGFFFSTEKASTGINPLDEGVSESVSWDFAQEILSNGFLKLKFPSAKQIFWDVPKNIAVPRNRRTEAFIQIIDPR